MLELIAKELERFGDIRKASVLDVGCGRGYVGEKLRGLGAGVYGIDGSSAALETASSRGLAATQGDLDGGLPYRVATFDIVLAAEILEHLFDPQAMLGEIARVLKPGGAAVITVPSVATLVDRIYLLFGGLPWQASLRHPLHIRCFTLSSLKQMIATAGMRVEKVTANTIYLGTRNRKILDSAFLGACFPQYGDNLIVLARNITER